MCCIIKIKDLTHPLVEPYAQTSTLVNLINKNNYTFITHHKLMELNPNPLIYFCCYSKMEKGSLAVLETVSKLLLTIKDSLSNDDEEEKITKALCFHFKVINKLINYYSQHKHIDKIDTLYAIYKQVIDLAEVSFEGSR
jgi:hypothetical protein